VSGVTFRMVDRARLKGSQTADRLAAMRAAARFLAALAVPLLACAPEVTFTKDIAPILQAKCQACHRPGQIAPMPLLTYQEVRPYAHAIHASVAMGNMPPFYAAGPPGYFKDDIRLTEQEKQLLADWANAGAPEGDPALLPAPIAWDDSEWPLGEPDLDQATQNQSLALDRMRKGAQSMAQQMMENGNMQAGQGPGNNGRDPLGRPDRSNRPDLGLSVQVPDEIDIQKAREVLDELRRRVADPSRPNIELDYLERLIREF